MAEQTIENEREGKSLREIQAAERQLFLRKTDVVPFSGGKTVADLRKARAEHDATQEAERTERRANALKKAGVEVNASPAGTQPLYDKKETAQATAQTPATRPLSIPNATSGPTNTATGTGNSEAGSQTPA